MTIYLDHNATTPVRPEAADAVRDALAHAGNPSSVHGAGRRARKIVEDAREQVAALAGARADDVIFTSGGTEANNLALANATVDAAVFVSDIEHASVLDARPDASRIAVQADGVVDPAAVDAALKDLNDGRALVSVMLANNETGAIQPVAEIAEVAKRHGAAVHCDAVQAAGKMAVDMKALGVDMLSLSAHKIGGPQGIGALVIRPGFKISATHWGGGQERSRRAGTENVPGIAGFGVAAERALAGIEVFQELALLRDRMEAHNLKSAPEARVFARDVARLANTSCITMPGISAKTQVMSFDLEGFAVSAGSACSSGKVESSHVLKAMGADTDQLNSALRISLGWTTTANEIDQFTAAWTALYARLGAGSMAA
ncbi:MAG: cysteine desulfurase family protein [Rhodospirillaceae bacterium]